MSKIPTIKEKKSYVPLRIESFFNDQSLALGTAFFYRHKDSTYFVTNWHNVTGRNPNTGQPLSDNGGVPNKLKVKVPFVEKVGDQSGIRWKISTIELYNDDKPIWFIHPVHFEKVDIVCMELNIEDTAVICANDISLDLEEIRLYPSIDLFVIGYPFGMYGGARFPIWKRATLASEPDFDIDDLPKLFIDTATREGMSGSPVYAQEVGLINTENSDIHFGKSERFLGVYSGRIGANDEFKAQIGFVWKESAIIETIEGNKFGKSSFDYFSKET